jgi:hypothetical protein
MKLGFWELKITAATEIGQYGILNQSEQPTQFGHFSDLDSHYQQ